MADNQHRPTGAERDPIYVARGAPPVDRGGLKVLAGAVWLGMLVTALAVAPVFGVIMLIPTLLVAVFALVAASKRNR